MIAMLTQWLPILWFVDLILAVWALVVLVSASRRFELREGVWSIFIVVVPILGPITYLLYQKFTSPKYPVW